MTSATQHAIDAVWRIESARLIAGLAGVVRDVGLAEDLAQDALVAALEQWPESGVPDRPGAWLMAVARRRSVDTIRRAVTLQSKVELLGRELSEHQTPMDEIGFDAGVEDDVLRLMFTACHPVLSVDARAALTLKMVAGLSTEEIARAFLVQTTTMAARITRAKKTLTEANVPFEDPVGDELADRLGSVLEAVYLIFNEGYTATAGEQWARAELCLEAMRLGRMLAASAPAESETHALVALMEIQASRLLACSGSDGKIVTLDEQERARWDRLLITHGLPALDRAEEIGGTGFYAIQAKIAACHARAPRAEDTDWVRIAARPLRGGTNGVRACRRTHLEQGRAHASARPGQQGLINVRHAQSDPASLSRIVHVVEVEDLAARVDSLIADEHFSGVIRIDRDGAPVLERAAGWSHRAHRVPMTVDTRLAMASGSKWFTALVVLSLAADGTLPLTTPARELLGADLPLVDDRVTVEHLLAHRSGIGDYLDESGDYQVDDYVMTVPVHQLADSNDYLKVLDGYPQQSTPGERFAYNNGGFVLLAILAERAAGTAFVDLVQQRVCTTANMVDTAYLRSDSLPERTALGYLDVEGHRSNVLHLPVRGTGDGGAYTTVADIHRLWRALLDFTVLDQATLSAAWRPRSDVPAEGTRCGLGFFLHATEPGVMLDGSDAGVSFRTVHDPDSDTTHTVIANRSNGAWPITRALDQMLLGW